MRNFRHLRGHCSQVRGKLGLQDLGKSRFEDVINPHDLVSVPQVRNRRSFPLSYHLLPRTTKKRAETYTCPFELIFSEPRFLCVPSSKNDDSIIVRQLGD